LDTYGDENFDATVVSIAPAATSVNGVGAYAVKLQFNGNDERIKSGMTANIGIKVGERKGVLAVPERSVMTRGDAKIVMVLDGSNKTSEREVKIGEVETTVWWK